MHASSPQTAGRNNGIDWRRLGMHLAVALLVIGAGVAFTLLFPSLALAQNEVDPFAEAETKFGNFLRRLKFWVWGVSAMGLAFYVIAYGGQALWPSWYGSMRDFLRTGAVLIVVFNVVFAFLVTQADQAQKSPASIVLVPHLFWYLQATYRLRRRRSGRVVAQQPTVDDHAAAGRLFSDKV